MKRVFYILLLMLLFPVLLYGCRNDSQNKIDKDELITKTYPESIYEEIQHQISIGGGARGDVRDRARGRGCVRGNG